MKKKIMSWLLIFAMVIGFAPVNLYANKTPQTETVTAESDFDFDESTGTIKSYKGTDTEVVIPSKVGGVAVKEIGKKAFGGKKTHFSYYTRRCRNNWARCLYGQLNN